MFTNNALVRIKTAALILLVHAFAAAANAQYIDSARLAGPEVFTISSTVLGEKRKIRIQLPAGADRYSAYPVLYVLDGESQSNHVAGQVQYLSESYKIIPNLIVVSIDNTDRMRDLTPSHTDIGPDGKRDTSASSAYKNTGGSEKFLQFIKAELMPFVEKRYRTAPFRILYGHSLGALTAVYCLLSHPDYFNAYIAVSPSFQWDNNALLKAAETASFSTEKNRLLFFSDANEDTAFHQNQLRFESLLQRKGSSALMYKRMFYPEESHISEPVKAFYDGIRFVYPSWHLPYNSSAFRKTMSSEVVKSHFAKLTQRYGYKVVPLHDDMILIGRFFRNDPARIKDAIEILQINGANYPTSVINLETLGDTYLKANEKSNAIAAYQRAIALEPANAALLQKLTAAEK